jgi:hypothetical protein
MTLSSPIKMALRLPTFMVECSASVERLANFFTNASNVRNFRNLQLLRALQAKNWQNVGHG